MYFKLLQYGFPIFLIILALFSIFKFGEITGKNKIQNEWNQAKLEYKQKVDDYERVINYQLENNRKETSRINYELSEAKREKDVSIARIRAESSNRLRQYQERERLYSSYCETRTNEQGSLVSITIGFDRAITEGIGLVEELSATLRERDKQIKLIYAQLENDRSLLGNLDGSELSTTK